MPSLSFAELNSADSDYVDQGGGYDCYTNTYSRTLLACTGPDGSDDEDQDENMSPFDGLEPV